MEGGYYNADYICNIKGVPNKFNEVDKVKSLALGYSEDGDNEEEGSFATFEVDDTEYILTKLGEHQFGLYEEGDFEPFKTFLAYKGYEIIHEKRYNYQDQVTVQRYWFRHKGSNECFNADTMEECIKKIDSL